jgi:poly(3-hydroxyalkanoate) synthetase
MGGLLALALATHRPDAVRSLTLLATPWDFHAPDPGIGPQFLALAETLEDQLDQLDRVPAEMIQGLFAALQPLQALTKFSDFALLDPGSMEARQFVLVEDWLNDGIPLTAPVARECLIDWYGKNVTANNKWKVAGKLIEPQKLAMPSYVVAPGRDRIVPPESALALAKLLPHVTRHEPMTGHIGMMAGRNAAHQVWAPLLHWLEEHG